MNPVVALPKSSRPLHAKKTMEANKVEISCLIQTERTLRLYDQIKQYATASLPMRQNAIEKQREKLFLQTTQDITFGTLDS